MEFNIEEVYDMVKDRVLKTIETHTNHNPAKDQIVVQVYGAENTAKLQFVVEIKEDLLPFTESPYR